MNRVLQENRSDVILCHLTYYNQVHFNSTVTIFITGSNDTLRNVKRFCRIDLYPEVLISSTYK